MNTGMSCELIPKGAVKKLLFRGWDYFPGYVFVFLLFSLENIYGRYFPNMYGLVGHDFSLTSPALLDGAYWFWNNSILDVPWFTPSFCGGQPFFADPQSAYYSPLQWLAFVLPPTQASHCMMLLASSVGYWSFYCLLRHVFQCSVQGAVVAGSLAMMNGFVPYRFLIGETYQLLLLTGFVSHALLSSHAWPPLPRSRSGVGNIFWAGIAIAMMLQSGLTTLMLPAALSVLAVAMTARFSCKGVVMGTFLLRSSAACAFAISLCASKILASTTFMSHFPRESYTLPGFASLIDALRFPFYSLVLPSQTTWKWATPKITNAQWTIFPHEWAYQFGMVFLLLLLTGLYLFGKQQATITSRNTKAQNRKNKHAYLLVTCTAVILLLPTSMLWFTPTWNAILKSIPVIKTTSFPFRWIIIWIPLCCIAGAFAWQVLEQKIRSHKESLLGVILLIIAMLLEATLVDKTYYLDPQIQAFDPAPVDQAWRAARNGHIPPISKLTDFDQPLQINSPNDAMTTGESFIHCYNPAYGYRQETLPVGRLKSGESVFAIHDGHLNIKNPACLIWPEENNCSTLGDEYTQEDMEDAKRFTNRTPVNFKVSHKQQIANIVTILAIFLSALGVLLSISSIVAMIIKNITPRTQIKN